MRADLTTIAAYAGELDRWEAEHLAAGLVHECESAYRFLLSSVDNLLDEDRVLHERAAIDSATDIAAEGAALKRAFDLLRVALSRLLGFCERSDLLAYEPRVIDLDALRGALRRAERYLAFTNPKADDSRPDDLRQAESELRAAWGA